MSDLGHSQWRTARLLATSRTFLRYQSQHSELNEKIITRLHDLATQHTRLGVWIFHRMLLKEGFHINHKRTERLYRLERLSLRLKKRRKFKSTTRIPSVVITKPNQKWSMDFIYDTLWDGRKFKTLSVLDIFTRENLKLEVDTSLGSVRVVRALNDICQLRGFPESIRLDNGPEFTSRLLYDWATRHGVVLEFSRLGKPTDNAHVESFHGKFRNECLSEHYFISIKEARWIIENWRITYNGNRPHRSLQGLTPDEFMRQYQLQQNPGKFYLAVV